MIYMVKVTEKVYEGLKFVRTEGLVNMFDIQGVTELAKAMGFKETVQWIQENKNEYSRGILKGFKAD